MKNFVQLLSLIIVSMFFLLCLNISAQAQSQAVIEEFNKAADCFEKYEEEFGAASSKEAPTNDDRVERVKLAMPILEKLTKCGDKSLKMRGLPLKQRQILISRKKEYLVAYQGMEISLCMLSNIAEIEKGIFFTDKNTAAENRPDNLARLQKLFVNFTQARTCARRTLDSRTISETLKQPVRENLDYLDRLEKKGEDLKKTNSQPAGQ